MSSKSGRNRATRNDDSQGVSDEMGLNHNVICCKPYKVYGGIGLQEQEHLMWEGRAEFMMDM